MTQRYFIEPAQLPESIDDHASAKLTDAEAHHFLHVMRGKVGDELTLFDGQGHQFAATVTGTNRREVEVQITGLATQSRELPVRLLLAVSLPKGDRARWLIEKLTELGATSLTPLVAERAIAQPSGKALDKLRRYSVEACKQSGRNQLLELTDARSIEAFHEHVAQQSGLDETLRLVAHPYGATSSAGALVSEAVASHRSVAVVVGPEGGLAESEVAALHALGWQSVSLGSRILRIETAALALAALVSLAAESPEQ